MVPFLFINMGGEDLQPFLQDILLPEPPYDVIGEVFVVPGVYEGVGKGGVVGYNPPPAAAVFPRGDYAEGLHGLSCVTEKVTVHVGPGLIRGYGQKVRALFSHKPEGAENGDP